MLTASREGSPSLLVDSWNWEQIRSLIRHSADPREGFGFGKAPSIFFSIPVPRGESLGCSAYQIVVTLLRLQQFSHGFFRLLLKYITASDTHHLSLCSVLSRFLVTLLPLTRQHQTFVFLSPW